MNNITTVAITNKALQVLKSGSIIKVQTKQSGTTHLIEIYWPEGQPDIISVGYAVFDMELHKYINAISEFSLLKLEGYSTYLNSSNYKEETYIFRKKS